MLTVLLCFVASWGFGAGEARRVARTPGTRDERLGRLLRSRAQVVSLAAVLGVLASGELVLEIPQARPWWLVVCALTVYVFQVLCPALWAEAVRPVWDAVSGHDGSLPELEELLRSHGLLLLPRTALVAGIGLMTGRPPLGVLVAGYAGYLLLSTLAAPALYRLALPTRRPTVGERRRLREASASVGLALGDLRILDRAGGRATNGFVAGLWPGGSRICLTERLIETFDHEELGFVLAHEVAHRDRWHAAARFAVGLTINVVALLLALLALRELGTASTTSAGLAAMAGLAGVAWARGLLVGVLHVRQEHAADAFAVRRAGVPAAQRALVRLAHQNAEPMDVSWVGALRRGHPAIRDRLFRVSGTPAGVPAA